LLIALVGRRHCLLRHTNQPVNGRPPSDKRKKRRRNDGNRGGEHGKDLTQSELPNRSKQGRKHGCTSRHDKGCRRRRPGEEVHRPTSSPTFPPTDTPAPPTQSTGPHDPPPGRRDARQSRDPDADHDRHTRDTPVPTDPLRNNPSKQRPAYREDNNILDRRSWRTSS